METDLKNTKHEWTPKQEEFMRDVLGYKELTPDAELTAKALQEDFDRLRRQIESIPQPKVCLMSAETMLMTLHRIDTENKEFRFNGMPVIQDNRVEYGKILIMNAEEYEALQQENEPQEQPEYKPEPLAFRCRVCGTRYYSKQEAKECQRKHDWQNRKGRR